MLFLSMQVFSCVNLCDVILAYLKFLHSCKDYMLEKIFEINSNRVRAHNTLPLYSGACNRFLLVVSEPKSHDLHAKYYINYKSCNYIYCY